MAKPLNKEGPLADFLEKMSQDLYGRSRIKCIESDICVMCGEEAKEFEDEKNETEYLQSGLCQKCQEEVFKQEEQEEDDD